MNDTNKVVKNLERLYKTAIEEENPFAFYKALEVYIESVLDTPILKKVVDEQIKERNDLYEKIDRAEIESQKEMRKAKDKLLAFIKKNSVDTSNFFHLNTFFMSSNTDVVSELEQYEKSNNKESNQSKTLSAFLFDISANLLKLGHKDAVKDFLVSDEEYNKYYDRINGTSGYFLRNENGNFIFSKTWPERFEQENLLENGRVFGPWGAFEAILKFHRAFELVAQNVNFWSLAENVFQKPLRVEDFVDVVWMIEDLYHLGGKTHGNSPRRYGSSSQANKLDKLDTPAFKNTLQMVHNTFLQTLENNDIPEEKSSKGEKIKEITFIKKKTQPKPTYSFYINGNLGETKPLRSDSSQIRKLIEITENNDIAYNKDLLDYVNSNSNCALYCAGRYNLTKILERKGDYLGIVYGIKAYAITELEYKKKLNKWKSKT